MGNVVLTLLEVKKIPYMSYSRVETHTPETNAFGILEYELVLDVAAPQLLRAAGFDIRDNYLYFSSYGAMKEGVKSLPSL